jgi:hypothetical protein
VRERVDGLVASVCQDLRKERGGDGFVSARVNDNKTDATSNSDTSVVLSAAGTSTQDTIRRVPLLAQMQMHAHDASAHASGSASRRGINGHHHYDGGVQ